MMRGGLTSLTTRVANAVVMPLVTHLATAWVRSFRLRFAPLDSEETLPATGILVLWHADMLPCLRAFAGRSMRVLISSSRDGDLGTKAATRLGYRVIRGSSSRGGAEALRTIKQELDAGGGWVALVADGPRGPRGVSKPGAVWLSAACGVPVVAAHASAPRGFTLGGWARVRVPLPFSHVTVRLSTPFYPATSADVDAVMKNLDAPRQPLR
jgi:lysophospholipid acyltransferase (LPLAT)-like uncharacterized protein